MWHAMLVLMAFCGAPERLVVQHVDTISIAHVADGAELVFFWDHVQGVWSCLDHRWLASDMACIYDAEAEQWQLSWYDEGDDCRRYVHASHWIESWETDNPLAAIHNRPWFAKLLVPGLKMPIPPLPPAPPP